MFGSMKKAMVAAAVVAVGAMAGASAASADQWYADGNLVGGGSGVAVTGTGSVSFTVLVGGGLGATTTCDVEVTADLYNQSGVGHGQVTGVAAPVPGDCTVTGSPVIGDCRVTAFTPNVSTPWTIVTSGAGATISGVDVTYTQTTVSGGFPCQVPGPWKVTGSITGPWMNSESEGDPGILYFTDSVLTGVTPATGTHWTTSAGGGLGLVGAADGEEITLQ